MNYLSYQVKRKQNITRDSGERSHITKQFRAETLGLVHRLERKAKLHMQLLAWTFSHFAPEKIKCPENLLGQEQMHRAAA